MNMLKFSLQIDNQLFERCFRDNYQALCFFASGMLHDDAASEDVVQEVWAFWEEDDGEDLVLEHKGEDGEECYHDDTSQQHSP